MGGKKECYKTYTSSGQSDVGFAAKQRHRHTQNMYFAVQKQHIETQYCGDPLY